MTSKRRALIALNHEIPDRVPINYDANPGIDARLKSHFGLRVDDDEGLLRRLGVDFRRVVPEYCGPELHAAAIDRRVGIFGDHRRWIEHESGGYWDYCDFPLAGASEEEAQNFPLPSPDDFDYEGAIERCLAFRDYCIVLGHGGYADCINSTGMVCGMEGALMDFITGEGAGLVYMRRKNEIQFEVLRRFLEKAKGRVEIDILHIGEDLGTQIGPMISLQLYREVIAPIHGKFLELGKAHGCKTMIHTCGSSSWAYDDLIAMGLDIADTLQPEAVGMDPAHLKARYGDRLAFHGCISTAGPVERGTLAEVEHDIREKLAIMMPGGGYAFAPTHQLQDDSPTENVVRMYELGRELGKYQ